MKRTLAIRIATAPNAFAAMPLLGKPCDLRGEGPCEGCQ